MEVISRETIKPSPPTPPHRRTFLLSILDHIFPHGYVPLLVFYVNKAFEHNHDLDSDSCTATLVKVRDERSKMLRKSLSQVLAMYYPFAGRLRLGDGDSIECNDEGVTFLVTHFEHNLSQILQNPKQELINPLFADQLHWKIADASASFLAIQINHFACGGTAIAVCLSHKVGDAFTLCNFIKDWATITRRLFKPEEQEEVIFLPEFNGASIFPRGEGDLPIPEIEHIINTVSKGRFVFEGSKIRSLKAVVSRRVQNPTRVQLVSALIYKCFVSALRLSSVQCPNNLTTRLRFAVNLRTRMAPPPPEKSVGNMGLDFLVSTTNPSVEEELHELVSKIQQCLSEFRDTHAKDIERKDMSYFWEYLKEASSVTPNDDNLVLSSNIVVTSWCRFPMYETDFGWGKPIWVTSVGSNLKNVVILMDTRDGEGIEAHVSMEGQTMALFERNVELLQYASLNPSVALVDGL